MTGLYPFAFLCGILAALLHNGTLFKGEPVPFVMESNTSAGSEERCTVTVEKAKDFLQRAFSVIPFATGGCLFLQSFDLASEFRKDSSDSILAMAAGLWFRSLSHLVWGDWRIWHRSYQWIWRQRAWHRHRKCFQWEHCFCTDTTGSSITACIQPALYSMCGCTASERTWRKCNLAVKQWQCGCMDRRTDRSFCWHSLFNQIISPRSTMKSTSSGGDLLVLGKGQGSLDKLRTVIWLGEQVAKADCEYPIGLLIKILRSIV